MLAARDLVKTYRTPPFRRRVDALRGVSLAIAPGEVLGLLGPNGSGKTTLIRCCLGLLAPTSGDVSVGGARPTDVAARRRIGYAPERFDLAPRRTGREALELLARLSGHGARAAHERVLPLLDRVGLAAAADRATRGYSKGMLRRLALAAALLGSERGAPDLLVLDEPFDGLDPLGVGAMQQEIVERARGGAAVLVSSHALADLEAVATRYVILDAGRVLAAGSADEVLGAPGRRQLVVDGADDAARARVAEILREHGATLVSDEPARERLDQLFRRALGRTDGADRTRR